MHRIAGIETEYGCLAPISENPGSDAWPARIRTQLFRKNRVGLLDTHHRDYEEPPGNGGFLLNGGRIYMDMGHLEYATPECRSIADIVAYDFAGDALILDALQSMGMADQVAFFRNNIDHHTGATFGSHENYLLRRETLFTPAATGALLGFLATRQIFTGAGRVGHATLPEHDPTCVPATEPVTFQISQRADYIMNDIYQWVQFNRAIINARDEPLADYRRYRRLHLLLGDSNVIPYATALKIGVTHLLLTLLEENALPTDLALSDPVATMHTVSHAASHLAPVPLENGRCETAHSLQMRFLELTHSHLAGRDEETDWILSQWTWVLDALAKPDYTPLLGAIDWVTKRWLLDEFRNAQQLGWNDPWLQSLDLEYHHIDPAKSLASAVPANGTISEFNANARRPSSQTQPPADTRAVGRSAAVRHFLQTGETCIINWDTLHTPVATLPMPDPLDDYREAVADFIASLPRL